ncbi:MAG: hypothetical protein WCK67_11735 [bacterium]
MKFKELICLIRSDIYKYKQKKELKNSLSLLFNKSFIVVFLYRVCHYLYKSENKILLFPFVSLFRIVKERRYIDISYKTSIGEALYIDFAFGIALNEFIKIGNNVELYQCTTIGASGRDKSYGPEIGDNVILKPGSVVIGHCKVGNNVIVEANSVITKDIPDDSTVIGIPNIISTNV